LASEKISAKRVYGWHEASDSHNRIAQYELSENYMYGNFIQQDTERELELLRASAEAGYPDAQLALGHIFSSKLRKN
jgi:TPR repeat protein